MTVIDKNKTKEISIKEFEEFLKNVLSLYGIEGTYKIPSTPDKEGDYYIIVRASNISSNKKAVDLSHKVQDVIQNKYGKNIYISIIPA